MSQAHPIFGEVISAYTRTHALQDGVLVDITKMAKEAGFDFPTAISAAVYAIVRDETSTSDSVDGRLWDICSIAKLAMKGGRGKDRVSFEVIIGRRTQALYIHIGPGDTPAPVLTIMVQGED